jgi:hypothetical protein
MVNPDLLSPLEKWFFETGNPVARPKKSFTKLFSDRIRD